MLRILCCVGCRLVLLRRITAMRLSSIAPYDMAGRGMMRRGLARSVTKPTRLRGPLR